jgi:KaiC/GvpD/RAD55 family RecA-like ATPase
MAKAILKAPYLFPGTGSERAHWQHMAGATCRRGERCLYVAFEESESAHP